ncbi:hypothetical protein DVH24_030055, partial [Malus domestica]
GITKLVKPPHIYIFFLSKLFNHPIKDGEEDEQDSQHRPSTISLMKGSHHKPLKPNNSPSCVISSNAISPYPSSPLSPSPLCGLIYCSGPCDPRIYLLYPSMAFWLRHLGVSLAGTLTVTNILIPVILYLCVSNINTNTWQWWSI